MNKKQKAEVEKAMTLLTLFLEMSKKLSNNMIAVNGFVLVLAKLIIEEGDVYNCMQASIANFEMLVKKYAKTKEKPFLTSWKVLTEKDFKAVESFTFKAIEKSEMYENPQVSWLATISILSMIVGGSSRKRTMVDNLKNRVINMLEAEVFRMAKEINEILSHEKD